MINKKVAAIVPALNEASTVGNVLKVLLESKDLDEVILVDDGSVDKTAQIGRDLGAKVLQLLKNGGKGNAMKQGILATNADIIVFFDADLIGLTTQHVSSLIEPVLNNEAYMCVGVRDRAFGLARFIAKLSFIMAIGGERAMSRELFKKIPERFLQGFAVETALNYYCLSKKLPIKYVILDKLTIVIKEKKWGFIRGFANRLKMIWQMIKIRIIILFYKNEFI